MSAEPGVAADARGGGGGPWVGTASEAFRDEPGGGGPGGGAEDTVPASPEALLGAGRFEACADGQEAPLEANSFQALAGAGDSDGEDDAADVQELSQDAGLEEPWMSYPPQERELWERVRPRQLRREAAQVRALRLPTAGLARLMRVHPAVQGRSPEAMEVLNASTVLILQAVVRAALRGKGPGHGLRFEDVRQACLGAKELGFLHPLSHTLDASTFTTRSAAVDLDVDEAGNAVKRSLGAPPKPLGPGQRVLGAAMFAKATATVPAVGGAAVGGDTADAVQEADEDEGAGGEGAGAAEAGSVRVGGSGGLKEGGPDGVRAPEPVQEEEPGGPAARRGKAPGKKRRAPASAQKAPAKAPRRGSGLAAPPAVGGLAALFRAGAG